MRMLQRSVATLLPALSLGLVSCGARTLPAASKKVKRLGRGLVIALSSVFDEP